MTRDEHSESDLLEYASLHIAQAAKVAPSEGSGAFLGAWDAVISGALELRMPDIQGSSKDRLTPAINHPAGKLAQAILGWFFRGGFTRNAGLAPELRERLDRLMGSEGDGGQAARIVMASRLHLLHAADPQWTQRTLLPLMMWTGGSTEAQALWQGYLWSPSIDDQLLGALRVSLIQAVSHQAELGESAETLPGLLVVIALFVQLGLSDAEHRTCLRELGAQGRASLAWHLAKHLQASGEHAATLWKERIGPWIRRCWPRDMEYRADQQTPDRLAWLASLAGAEFADAVETIEPLLGPPSEVVLSFSAIQENGLATKFPREVLSLVHALVPADVDRFNNWRIHLLPEVLQDVAAADTSLENDLRFRRLRDTAIRAGLSFPPASQPNNPVTPRASTNE